MDVVTRHAQLQPIQGRLRSAGELTAAAGSLVLRFLSKGTPWAAWILVGLALAWAAYFAWRLVRQPGQWKAWGLGVSGLRQAILLHGAATLGMLIVAVAAGTLLGKSWPGVSPMAFVVYPVWGLAQEFALQCVFVAGLRGLRLPTWSVPWAAGLAFGVGHLPDSRLALVAGLAGVVWSALWLRVPCLWTLAVSHAVVGLVAVPLLLGFDPAGQLLGYADGSRDEVAARGRTSTGVVGSCRFRYPCQGPAPKDKGCPRNLIPSMRGAAAVPAAFQRTSAPTSAARTWGFLVAPRVARNRQASRPQGKRAGRMRARATAPR